jgi:hypothetical protein
MSQPNLAMKMDDDTVADAMAVMEAIRQEFKIRRGQTPAVRNDHARRMDSVHLKQVHHLAELTAVPIPVSHRKKVGKVIMTARRVLWKLLAPILGRQTDYNRSIATLMASLLQDREFLLKENRELRQRLDAMESRILQSEGSM